MLVATQQSWVWIPKRWVVLKALACCLTEVFYRYFSEKCLVQSGLTRWDSRKIVNTKMYTLSTLSLTWFCCWKSQVSFLITLLVCSFIKFMSVATSVISFIRCSLLPLMCLADVLLLTSCALTVNIASRSVFYELMYPADFWILFSQQCLFIVLESSFPNQILFILFFCHSLFSFQCFHRNKKFPVENTESRVGEIMFMVFVFNLFCFYTETELAGCCICIRSTGVGF